MIVTGEILIDDALGDYSSPHCKLGRMVEAGEIVRLKRNLYETDPNTPPYLVANALYGPSYISFEYALMRHNVIPEFVYEITCATYGKRKTKIFRTPLGRISYQDIPEAAFDVGIESLFENGREYRIATTEKAICDKLYKMPPTKNYKDLEALMFEDLRFDEDIVEDIYGYFRDEATSDDVHEAMEALGPDYYENEVRLVRIKFLCEIAS